MMLSQSRVLVSSFYSNFSLRKVTVLLGLSLSLLSVTLWAGEIEENTVAGAQIQSDFEDKGLESACDLLIESTKKKIADLIKDPSTNPLMAFERILSELSNQGDRLSFIHSVSTKESLRKESAACEEKVTQYGIEIYTDRALYEILKKVKNVPATQQRLLTKALMNFEDNGLALPEDQRDAVKKLNQTLVTLEKRFSVNLDEDTSKLEYTAEELDGLPKDFIDGLRLPENESKLTGSEKLIVPVQGPNYVTIMDNARSSESRRRMLLAWDSRGSAENVKIFEEALEVRKEIARLMGYANWADFRLKDRMAKNSGTALRFLNNLKERLSLRNQADLAKLLKFKKSEDPSATELKAWDIRYYSNQVKKADYQLDEEVIRTYFPKATVIQGMFQIYSRLLGVNFVEVELEDAERWAEGVQFFQIRDQRTDDIVGYFYTDFIPREGKYGHAAAFGVRSGRKLDSGAYLAPVTAIVANFRASEKGKPVLLTHDEVETLFHEFGHIMHMTLTRAPFGSLSGARVATDFVEAPSQMLENWVYSEDILTQLSGHYENPEQKLPRNLLQKIREAKDFNQGYYYTRQLIFGLYDMICHTSSKDVVDPTALFNGLHQELMGIPAVEGNQIAANFGHLMGGYDAAYYSYLWSDVYASDMFTLFEDKGLMNSELGHRYRRTILEQGNMKDAMDLLREFLGREPNSDAFFKKLLGN